MSTGEKKKNDLINGQAVSRGDRERRGRQVPHTAGGGAAVARPTRRERRAAYAKRANGESRSRVGRPIPGRVSPGEQPSAAVPPAPGRIVIRVFI